MGVFKCIKSIRQKKAIEKRRRTQMELLTEVLNLVKNFVITGGSLWLLWGVIILATGIKDKSGPQLQSGIWQIVGGGIILAAASLFDKVISGI